MDAPEVTAPPAAGPGRVARALWTAAGFVAVGVGGIGLVLPGLPTTVFFLIAAWCFGKASSRFEQWVLDLPGVGRLVTEARDGLGMPRRTKVVAIAMMWTAITVSSVVMWQPWYADRWWPGATLLALGLIGAAYVAWRVPTRETVLAERALSATPTP